MPSSFAVAQLLRGLAVDARRAGGRLLEPGEDAQDRRLAAARRAEQGEERALLGVQVRVLQRHDALAARA